MLTTGPETFRSKREKIIDIKFFFMYFPQKVLLESLEAILLSMPKNVCQ